MDENRIIPETQRTWTEAKNTIGPVEKFLQRLKNFQVSKVMPSMQFNLVLNEKQNEYECVLGYSTSTSYY